MKNKLTNFYNTLTNKVTNEFKENIDIDLNFVDGAYIGISNADDGVEYLIEFKDRKSNKTLYSSTLTNNMWARSSIEYYVDYNVVVRNKTSNKIILNHNISLKNKKVFISFESQSLGDTLAWIPYVEEFRKKHNCKIIVSTFLNYLFENQYPSIKFVEPNTSVTGVYAKYSMGWFWKDDIYVDTNRNPQDCRLIPLGQTASDILGLDYKEIKPLLNIPKESSRFNKKYVCISTHSTAQAKYWNKIGGWESVVKYLNDNGYDVVDIDRQYTFGRDECMNSIPPNAIDKTGDIPLTDRMVDLQHAEFFIGLGSGISWLSWAVGTPSILISSFSKPFCEFQDCIRVYKDSPTSGFFNDSRFRLDISNWNCLVASSSRL